MTYLKSLFLLAAAALLAFSCTRPADMAMTKISGQTQGTYYAISYFSHDSANLQPAVDSLLHRFDSSLSTYKPNSIISRMNNNDTTVHADQLFTAVWEKAMEVSGASGGAFDVTVGPLVNAWGFGFTNRMKVNKHVVDSLMPLVGYRKVSLRNGKLIKSDPRATIDFNAIAQGYAVDVMSRFLESKGISSYLVDIGGEVFARDTKPGGEPWNVAIEMPSETDSSDRAIQAVISLKDQAVSTSGNYRKYFEENGIRYSHTIDPATGYPVTHSLLSVSVLAADCITADAYATVFMVTGLEKAKTFLKDHPEIQAYFIYHQPDGQMQTWHTSGFDKILQK